MPNGIKSQVKEILQSNGWINNIEIAHQINKPVPVVDKILREFKRKGYVNAQPVK